jgi:hypothetical protein
MKRLDLMYDIVLKEYERSVKAKTSRGICLTIYELGFRRSFVLSPDEVFFLSNDLENRKPTIFSKFWYHSSYLRIKSKDGYWWDLNERGDSQRIEFLKYLRKKTYNEFKRRQSLERFFPFLAPKRSPRYFRE